MKPVMKESEDGRLPNTTGYTRRTIDKAKTLSARTRPYKWLFNVLLCFVLCGIVGTFSSWTMVAGVLIGYFVLVLFAELFPSIVDLPWLFGGVVLWLMLTVTSLVDTVSHPIRVTEPQNRVAIAVVVVNVLLFSTFFILYISR